MNIDGKKIQNLVWDLQVLSQSVSVYSVLCPAKSSWGCRDLRRPVKNAPVLTILTNVSTLKKWIFLHTVSASLTSHLGQIKLSCASLMSLLLCCLLLLNYHYPGFYWWDVCLISFHCHQHLWELERVFLVTLAPGLWELFVFLTINFIYPVPDSTTVQP